MRPGNRPDRSPSGAGGETWLVVEHLRRRVPGGVGTYARGLLGGLLRLRSDDPDEAERAELDSLRLWAGPSAARPDPLTQWGIPVLSGRIGGPWLTRLWDRGLYRPAPPRVLVHSVSLSFPPHAGPQSLMVHDLAFRTHPEAFPARGRAWHERALSRALTSPAVIVAPSQATAGALADTGAKQVVVIEHGCDHLAPPDPAATEACLARLGVGGPFLLSVGTQEPRKNLARVMQAYARARPRLAEPWPLVVVGPPGWGPQVTPVAGAVAAGAVPEEVLAGLYARTRCLIYAPLSEGFGLPAVEAMRAGAPVVASPMPSTAGAAREVDPNDVDSMVDGIVAAASDGPTREELVGAGLRRSAELTWAASARRHLELWRSLR